MLANLSFIGDNLTTVAIVVVVIMVVKFVICSAITRLFGYGHKTVLMVGTGLIQVGEFGFILALMGAELGILSQRLYSLTVASAIVTMLLTPFVISLNSFIYLKLSQRGWFARWLASPIDPDWHVQRLELSRHAVICGFGEVGARIAAVLEKQKFPYLVIDLDPNTISQLKARGVPCLYGDASSPEVLAYASLDKARVLLCTIPDYVAEELTVRNALRINPKLDIVARVHRERDVALLQSAGAAELVLPFFEGSLEMIRHTLHRFGMTGTEIQYILNTLRQGQIEQPGE
jgi:CPA2 family monovalent cation:H+ antiporter-2